MKLFDLINPVKIMAFFTFYGGGSGGGGSSNPDTRYSNLDALYGTQNQASQYMLDNAMPKIPGLMKNSQSMVDEAMDGTLASTMRNRASYDANESIASSNADAMRNLTKYGAVGDPSSGRFADTLNTNAKNSAATRVGAMNKANQFAEEQKWNRNANMYGQVMGMNSGAMQGMSSAASGMAGVAGQQSANDQKNAAGYGQSGAAFGAALLKADGGYIEGEKPVRLADGGDAWSKYKAANPVSSSSGSSRGGRTNPYMAMLSGASPYLAAAGVKDIFKGDKGTMAKAIKSLTGKAGSSSASASTPMENTIDSGGLGGAPYEAPADGSLYADQASYGMDAADAFSTGSDASSLYDTYDTANTINDAMSTAEPIAETALDLSALLADGGYIKKPGQHLALGGLASSSVANSDQIDGKSSVANNDASGAMSVGKMSTTSAKDSVLPTHAKPVVDTQFSGKTEGMGESSDGDPDGFGVHNGDTRHIAGKAVMSYYIPGGGILAEAAHSSAEPLTRTMITAGDEMGGVSGALLADPIGTPSSGKYSASDIAKGHLINSTGMPFLGKFLADGGRVDHTDGGDVQGPGTETSDDIPAWLSDGEIVENADAVDLPETHTKAVIDQWDKSGGSTKDLLLAINDAGLEKRKNQFACGGAVKHGVKLAGGGFLGGNLGIAMGAGVDQWNKQQELDSRKELVDIQKQQAEAAKEKLSWERIEQERKEGLRNEIGTIAKNQAAAADPNKFIDKQQDEAKAAAALKDIAYTPLTDEQKTVIQKNYVPDQSAADREYSAAFRKFGNLDAAIALEDKAKAREAGDNVSRSLLRGDDIKQTIGYLNDPTKAATLAVQQDIGANRIEAGLKKISDQMIARENMAAGHDAARIKAAEIKAGTAGSKSGSKSSSGSGDDNSGWDLKDVDTAQKALFAGDGPFQIQTGMDGKTPVIKEVPMNDAKTKFMSNMEMLRASGMSSTRAVPEAMKMTKLQLSGAPTTGDAYVPKVVLNGTKANLVMAHDDGSVSMLKQNLSDGELAKFNSKDADYVQLRKKALADDWMVKFGQAEENPAAKKQLMATIGLKTEEDYQAALQKAKDTWRQFDPASVKVDADVEKAQSNSRASASGKHNALPNKEDKTTTTRAGKALNEFVDYNKRGYDQQTERRNNDPLLNAFKKSWDYLFKDQVPK